MKRYLKNVFSDSILKNSSLIFISSILVNIFNLIFWLYMVRKLSPEDYGELNSLVSLLMFFAIPFGILQTVITRYISKFMAHDRRQDVKTLLYHFTKIMGIFILPILFGLFLCAHHISNFLRIDAKIFIYIIGVGLFFNSFSTITMGLLSGLQQFNKVALNSIASGLLKLVAGFLLVALGLKVLGALIGFIFSFIVTLVFSFFQLPSWLKKVTAHINSEQFDLKEIYTYFLPVGLGTLCFFALTNTDIILVKHFFSPLEAGYYSVAQMVGKIVLFVPGAIGVVMFPKVVDSHAKNINPRYILKKCVAAVGILCGIATFFSVLFPDFILKVLTGHTQPEAVILVKYFSLSMSFFAMVNILVLYHVSLHRMSYIYIVTIVTLLQILGICMFHATLQQVLFVLLFCSVLLFYLGIYIAGREKTVANS